MFQRTDLRAVERGEPWMHPTVLLWLDVLWNWFSPAAQEPERSCLAWIIYPARPPTTALKPEPFTDVSVVENNGSVSVKDCLESEGSFILTILQVHVVPLHHEQIAWVQQPLITSPFQLTKWHLSITNCTSTEICLPGTHHCQSTSLLSYWRSSGQSLPSGEQHTAWLSAFGEWSPPWRWTLGNTDAYLTNSEVLCNLRWIWKNGGKQACSIQTSHNNICGSDVPGRSSSNETPPTRLEVRFQNALCVYLFYFGLHFAFLVSSVVCFFVSSVSAFFTFLMVFDFCRLFVTCALLPLLDPPCQVIRGRVSLPRVSVPHSVFLFLPRCATHLPWLWWSASGNVRKKGNQRKVQLSGEGKDTSDHICALHHTDEGARSPHRGFPMRVGQDVVDLDLALVQGAQIHPQLIGPVICWTKTLPSVVPLGVLLRGKSEDF